MKRERENTRENLKNGLTHLYLTGTPVVYKIKSPNGRQHRFVNKTSLASLLNRKNINTLNRMISKTNIQKYIARRKNTMRNFPIAFMVQNPHPNSFHNNFTRKENYTFRKWNNNYGMMNPRGPFGAPIKLTNVNHHKLSPENLRFLRRLRGETRKNNANFARQQAAKNAERRKYVYRIHWRENNTHTAVAVANADFKYIGRTVPVNATRANNHNTSHIRAKFKRWMLTNLEIPNYNMTGVKIEAYRLKN
jgi:hypothetical protein